MNRDEELSARISQLELELARNNRRFERERLARKEAERLLESKSLELFQSNESLRQLTNSLEQQVHARTQELEQEKDHALYLSQIKSQFVATMSHEIRTPLNGIISVLELLQQNLLDDEPQQLLKIAHHSSRTLLSIINDILDFSKIEAGQMQIENVAFDLHQLLKSIFMSFERKAERKGIELLMHIDSKVPTCIKSDPVRLTQILNNYLSNGIKFTEYGSVQLNVMMQDQLINFAVCDTGVGIPEEKLDLLFKDFSQVDASTTRKYGGTGLGLVITKRIVEVLQGTVNVSSKLGSGSCFSAILPLQLADQQEMQSKQTAESIQRNLKLLDDSDLPKSMKTANKSGQERQSHGHILLIDDNAVNRLVGEKTLHALGFEVTLAPSGFDAIDKLSIPHDYDLILMDCQMPELSGYDATKILRDKGIKLPILALTANTSNEDRHRAQASGMDDFITKPFSLHDIRDILLKHLHLSLPEPKE